MCRIIFRFGTELYQSKLQRGEKCIEVHMKQIFSLMDTSHHLPFDAVMWFHILIVAGCAFHIQAFSDGPCCPT